MDAQPPKDASVVASFPPPPIYYKMYSKHPNNQWLPPKPPPPLPSDDTYTMYGCLLTTKDAALSLTEQGRQQLYPDPSNDENLDHVQELLKLQKSLLFKYLELVDVLVKYPSLWKEKASEIDLILVNMHHLINDYRPHQARDILIQILEAQLQRRKNTICVVNQQVVEVQSVLKHLINALKTDTISTCPDQSLSTTDD